MGRGSAKKAKSFYCLAELAPTSEHSKIYIFLLRVRNYQGKANEWAKHDLWVRLRQPTIISLCVGEKKRNTEKSVRRIH